MAACVPGSASNPSAYLLGQGIYSVTLGSLNFTSGTSFQGYEDYSCLAGTLLTTGRRYPLTIRTNGPANVRVWADYNNDGQFNATTELVFSSDNASVHTGTSALVPATGQLGTRLRLRVSADGLTSPIPQPCSTPQFAQVEDYYVQLQANTQAPEAVFAVNATTTCTGSFAFTDLSQNLPTSWVWRFGDGTRSTQQNPTHTYATPGTYAVTLRVCNGNGCDSLVRTNYLTYYGTAPVAAACSPLTSGYCCGYGITQVTLGSFVKASADGAAGYEDFTCGPRLTVQEGQVVPVAIRTAANPQDVRIYLDYNNDGVFAGADELVFEALNAVNPTGSFAIKNGVAATVPLRLRVLADAPGYPAGGCGPLSLGQAEDYAVLVQPSGCTSALPVPVVRGTRTLCTNERSTLAADTVPPGAWLQWQVSTDSLNWTNLVGEHAATYRTPPVVQVRYYRLRRGCGASEQTSVPVGVRPNPRLCYCDYQYFLPNCDPAAARIQRVSISYTSLNNPGRPCTSTRDSSLWRVGTTQPYQTTTLQQGATYQLNVTITRSAWISCWIDYNRNGVFEVSEHITVSRNAQTTTAGVPVSVLLTVPPTALPGPTGLRVRTIPVDNTYQNQACFSAQEGESHDYTILLAPPSCAAPLSGGIITGPRTFCPPAVPALAVLGQTPGTSLQWQTSADSLTWADVAGNTTRTYTGPAFTDTTYVRVRVSCGVQQVYSPVARINPDFMLCYCRPRPRGSSSCYGSIARIRIGNTPFDSQLSFCGTSTTDNGYGLVPPTLPQHTATLLREVSYPLNVTTDAALGYTTVRVWIDYNHDGRLEERESTLVRTWNRQGRDDNPAGATLTIPAGARLGATRMRVAVLHTSTGLVLTSSTVCAGFQGEVQDYTITIGEAPTAPALTAGTLQSEQVMCTTVAGWLTLSGHTRGARLQWQVSANATTWQDIAGITGTGYTVPVAGAGRWYRVRVSAPAGGAAVFTSALQAPPVVPCPCALNLNQQFCSSSSTIREVYFNGPNAHLRNYNNTCTTVQQSTPQPTRSNYTSYGGGPDSTTAVVRRGEQYNCFARVNYINISSLYVWMDFNHNGQFDASEMVGNSNTVIWNNTFFTIPATTPLGPLAVRVRVGYNPMFATDACTRLQSGETEDYVLWVTDTPTFLAPEIQASGGFCTGGTGTLGVAPLAGASYQWEGPNNFSATTPTINLTNLSAADAGYYLLTTTLQGYQNTVAYPVSVRPCTGVRPATAASKLELFPNPTHGRSTLRLTAPGEQQVQVQVVKVTGELVSQTQVRGVNGVLEKTLDLPSSPGLYLVRVTGKGGNWVGKLLVE